ncbi:MAG: short-chain dehydrogenase [Rhodospirillales bacterium 69-11]|nr:MAG: short-chain dehydrogenase [Rhodospirillales bacterium 69-11]
MHPAGKVCVVTGAASGIGAATARAFAAAGARGVVVADTNAEALARVAQEIGGLAVPTDVGREDAIQALIRAAEEAYGPVDVFFSNAGLSRKGHEEIGNDEWDLMWRVHVMTHVYVARALLPGMLARGSGYLLSTASAAGLLASLSSTPYTVTKHAAVALAESLAIQYGDRGIRVSVLCPQAVRTGMFSGQTSTASMDGVMEADDVARMILEAMEAERFLILPHGTVHEYMQRKAADPDRWLAGMRRLRQKLFSRPAAGA